MAEYALREPTRSEHLREIEKAFGFRPFNAFTYREMAKWLLPTALSIDKGIGLVTALIEEMRIRRIIIPALSTVERLGWEVRRRVQKLVFKQLTENLTDTQRHQLNRLLVLKPDKQRTDLIWLRQSPGPPTPNNFNKVVERLEFIRELKLDPQWRQQIHQRPRIGKQGYSPEVVERFIRRVFETQNPRTRYAIIPNPIGNWFLPLALSDRWLDKLISRNFGLLPEK